MSGTGGVDLLDGMEVDSASGFMSRTLMVLKGKTSPETRLSTEDLQVGSLLSPLKTSEGTAALNLTFINAVIQMPQIIQPV